MDDFDALSEADEMHRLPSRYAVIRFKLAAWSLITLFFLLPATLGFVVYALTINHPHLIWLALSMMPITLLICIIQWMLALRARCPLCHVRPLAKLYCSLHRSARKLFGSFRIRVAFSILFTNTFRCPGCGESTAIEPRQHSPRRFR